MVAVVAELDAIKHLKCHCCTLYESKEKEMLRNFCQRSLKCIYDMASINNNNGIDDIAYILGT